jgi:hypothetical protein
MMPGPEHGTFYPKTHRLAIPLGGQRFGRLLVLRRSVSTTYYGKSALWLCRCDCGCEVDVTSERLRKGETRSCGCLRRDVRRQMMLENNPRTKKP